MAENKLDLAPYSSSNRNFRLSRVFRDPSPAESGISNSKFELWIAFEFDGGNLVAAQVLKTDGINRPHSQVQIRSIDIQIALGVAKEHEIHRTDRQGVLTFLDHFAERSFEVKEADLYKFLEKQLASVLPKRVSRQNAPKDKSSKPSDQSRKGNSAVVKRNGDGLLGEIDALLEQSVGFIEHVRATNLDGPTRQ